MQLYKHFGDWLVPDWPAPAHVKAVCTTRADGSSLPPYNGMNLGAHVGDDPTRVSANRAELQRRIGAHPVYLNQVHGTSLLELQPDTPDSLEADGCFTRNRQLACTVMVADCLPVLLCDVRGTWVAAVHAGWRGLAGPTQAAPEAGQGVLEVVLKQYMPQAPVDISHAASKVIAWLGPCIGPSAFEVGEDVRQAFLAQSSRTAACFTPSGPGKWLANLPALARLRLELLGVNAVFGNDGSPEWCTVGNPSRFFSFRRDRITGRQAACIWLS
jgi:YfiH family protein